MLPNRREMLKVAGAAGVMSAFPAAEAEAGLRRARQGWIRGQMTGAEALVEALLQEGTGCVFGIPGAQENELWDTFKTKGLPYLLVTHEFSASGMADGAARATGHPGVLCVVPGPGVTNILTGLGEALLDSVPIVAIVGDVGIGNHARAFQVHALPQAQMLQPVCKRVLQVQNGCDIPFAIRQAFQIAAGGEPGPVAVVVPYNLFIETHRCNSGPLEPMSLPFDVQAFRAAINLLCDRRLRVGIYAGWGCMNYSDSLVRLAETLQSPVATSMAGKGAMPETHPLAVGWGYGAHATRTAEQAFSNVDVVLALGVKYSEVSTGFYGQPSKRHLIHVDIQRENIGRVMPTTHCVHADAGLFLTHALAESDTIRRAPDARLPDFIRSRKREETRLNEEIFARCGVDPMLFLRTLRCMTRQDAMAFVDVTVSQYWATETFTTSQPRTFFNPTNNQNMGWSIPAALGAQRVCHGRQVVTVTGDGSFLMSGMELSTAVREGLPVKFFILDDQAYHYMQELQRPAYLRTTATILAHLDYRSLAAGWGIAYQEILGHSELEAKMRGALDHPGPVLVRVPVDYRRREVRWIKAVRERYTRELTPDQKLRFLTRIATRSLDRHPAND
ncbi:MAG: thiamine pyrophosphate-binding protein [Gemmataceae bacterium]|nr:thiamine pyrophosphate-binding protein [Gemmataceae bacterium]